MKAPVPGARDHSQGRSPDCPQRSTREAAGIAIDSIHRLTALLFKQPARLAAA